MSKLTCLLFVFVGSGVAQEPMERLVPPALQPFEHLVGSWRAHGFLESNKQQGWDEPATWGWLFEKGRITGMEVSFQNGRYMTRAILEPVDRTASDGSYRLRITTGDDKEATYEGGLKFGKNITFVRKSGDMETPEQVTLQMLHDVRYVMFVESKKGSVVRRVATIGATRADVRFGAASKEEQGPKCIVTGAPGTSTVSYNGQTYYVCCSGCAAEFKHDPEKWLKLAKEVRGKDAPTAPMSTDKPKKDAPTSSTETKKETKAPGEKAASDSKAAATLLSRAKLLEKNLKPDEAAKLYERVVKEYGKTVEAREAASRLKSLRDSSR